MKVFAEFIEDGGFQFRRNTILQFEDTWNIIGSAVLLNPGSASPRGDIGSEDFNSLSEFFNEEHKIKIDKNQWYNFSVDPTMRQLEKIFNGSYIGKDQPLSGIIQLHNLFNLRNANLGEALSQMKNIQSDYLFSQDMHKTFKSKPIYLGWGKYLNESLGVIAQGLLKDILESDCPSIYNANFESNKFYHPGSQVSEQINRARKVLVCYLCNWKYNKFHPNLFYAH